MAKLVKLQDQWRKGMRQDIPRTEMVDGSAWLLKDFIPDLQAPLRKAGGWAYESATAISAASSSAASATYIFGLSYAPFTSPQTATLVAFDEDGRLYRVNIAPGFGGAITDVGNAVTPLQTAYHANKLIIPASSGSAGVKYYDGASIGALSASAPCCKYATVYGDRTLLANVSGQEKRVYFSAGGDPTTWDTTNSWIDVGRPVTGLAALPGALLAFQDTRTSRIRGQTPPPGSDMILDDPIFEIGCTDARSIDVRSGIVAFANPEGVYTSNGTGFPTDLTEDFGIKRYWQDALAGYSASVWTLAGGFYQNIYVIAVMNGTTFKDSFFFDLENFRFWRKGNLTAVCFSKASQVSGNLWFGLRDETMVGKISTIFAPAAAVKNDGDGTAVAPTLETPFYGASPPGLKTWRQVYLEYDCRDAATDNPILTISYLKNPEDSYTALATTLAETTNRARKRLALRFPSDGIGLKIAQTNASSDTRIYALEADVHAREPSRLAQ